jgi:hypothetical protein
MLRTYAQTLHIVEAKGMQAPTRGGSTVNLRKFRCCHGNAIGFFIMQNLPRLGSLLVECCNGNAINTIV